MKAQNKFKEPIILKEEESNYTSATSALVFSIILFAIAGLLSLISTTVAFAFILFCILYTVILIRLVQTKS